MLPRVQAKWHDRDKYFLSRSHCGGSTFGLDLCLFEQKKQEEGEEVEEEASASERKERMQRGQLMPRGERMNVVETCHVSQLKVEPLKANKTERESVFSHSGDFVFLLLFSNECECLV